MSTILPLELRALHRSFGRQRVLSGIDLRISQGEVVAIIGANGSGKTTLFSILAGLAPAQAGEVVYGELGSRASAEVRARLSYLAHEPQAYPVLTARENLQLYSEILETVGRQTRAISEVLESVGLGEAADRPVGAFSRGMKQRVAVGRVLMQQPELLILDEPFTALDRVGRAWLAQQLKDEASRGAGVLLCSHDMESVAMVSDRTLLLENGRLRLVAQRHASSGRSASNLDQGNLYHQQILAASGFSNQGAVENSREELV